MSTSFLLKSLSRNGRWHKIANLTLPSGAFITNNYDAVGRLLSTGLKNSAGTNLNSHRYLFNLAGQRSAATNLFGDYRIFTYDNFGQLKTALGYEPTGIGRWQEQVGYAYDAAGNLSWRTNNALTQALAVNSVNELSTLTLSGAMTVAGTTTSSATNVAVWGTSLAYAQIASYVDNTWARTNVPLPNGAATYNALAQDNLGRSDTNTVNINLLNTNSFQYDANGNLTNDGARSFTYDDENELISVIVTNGTGASTRTDLSYDGKLRCRLRKEFVWQGNAWTQTNEVHYVYDGNLVVQERDANNLPLVTYTRGVDFAGGLQHSGGTGSLLARTDHGLLTSGNPSAHAFYHADSSGNITALINTNQSIVARYLYDSYGNVLSLSGPLGGANLYRAFSRETYLNSSLIHYLYRVYDSNLQRWLNSDPGGEAGGLNLHSFADNNPANHFDPWGLNAYVINAGGYTGHTSFVVVDSSGGVVAYHFFAGHHGGGYPWYLEDLGALYDSVHIWSQYSKDLETYLAGEATIYGDVTVLAVGVGTEDDDARAISRLNQEIVDQEGYYSLIGGSECHRQSWDWYHDYIWGGHDVPISQLVGNLTFPLVNGNVITPPPFFTLTPAFSLPQVSTFTPIGSK